MRERKREPNEQQVWELRAFLDGIRAGDAVLARANDGDWYPATCSYLEHEGRWYVVIDGNTSDDFIDDEKVWPLPVGIPR